MSRILFGSFDERKQGVCNGNIEFIQELRSTGILYHTMNKKSNKVHRCNSSGLFKTRCDEVILNDTSMFRSLCWWQKCLRSTVASSAYETEGNQIDEYLATLNSDSDDSDSEGNSKEVRTLYMGDMLEKAQTPIPDSERGKLELTVDPLSRRVRSIICQVWVAWVTIQTFNVESEFWFRRNPDLRASIG